MIDRICLCGTSFQARPQDIARGQGKYCSRACFSSYYKRPKPVPNAKCAWCSAQFYRTPSKLQSKSGLVFCDRHCKEQAQKLGGLEEIQPSHYGTRRGRRPAEELLTLIDSEVCQSCGEGRKYLLVVHHIDGDGINCQPNNLELLCHNCHALRHLKLVNGQWKYDTKALTPRDQIDKLQRRRFTGYH